MPERAATIKSLPAAFEVVKAMQAEGLDRGEGIVCWPARPGRDHRGGRRRRRSIAGWIASKPKTTPIAATAITGARCRPNSATSSFSCRARGATARPSGARLCPAFA